MNQVPDALAAKIINHLKGYALVGVAEDGAITDWVADAEAITGYSREEAVGMNFSVLFTEPDRAAGAPRQEIDAALECGRYEDSRWHLRKDGGRFWGNGLALPFGENGAVVIKIFRDETNLRLADEQRLLLLNELNHRVKNTLATVQSVAEQTLRSAGVEPAVRNDLTDRLIALSRAHNVLVEQNWAGADLDVLVRDVIEPHERTPSPFGWTDRWSGCIRRRRSPCRWCCTNWPRTRSNTAPWVFPTVRSTSAGTPPSISRARATCCGANRAVRR